MPEDKLEEFLEKVQALDDRDARKVIEELKGKDTDLALRLECAVNKVQLNFGAGALEQSALRTDNATFVGGNHTPDNVPRGVSRRRGDCH